jgi:hypothetical protein
MIDRLQNHLGRDAAVAPETTAENIREVLTRPLILGS